MSASTDYISRMQSQLGRWDAEVEVLRAKGRNVSYDARPAYLVQIKSLGPSREAARLAFQAVQGASEESVLMLQAGMNSAWARMATAMQRVVSALPT
jgi:hypothetical protein